MAPKGIVVLPMFSVVLALCAAMSQADRPNDLVASLPDFPGNASTWGFKLYSGFIDVPGPLNGYDSLRIHYEFHTSKSSTRDPVVAWHSGGPGSSSVTVGAYNEMGPFRIAEHTKHINPYMWNRVAQMLYLESPAGSDYAVKRDGYSACIKGGHVVTCKWNDQTQGEAYAHTLKAFFEAFPEYASNDLYLVGESYAGQYIPNIAYFIISNKGPGQVAEKFNLKGLAIGNGCSLGNETLVACDGPSEDKIDAEFLFGKGLYSPKLKKQMDAECIWPTEYTTGDGTDPSGYAGHATLSKKCKHLLNEMYAQVGPHNVYNIYDTCDNTDAFYRRTGKDIRWLKKHLRKNLHRLSQAHAELTEMNAGYQWDCYGDVSAYFMRKDVKRALHLEHTKGSHLEYVQTGPASVVLYPELAKHLRILIYNGDADACVPLNGNEALIDELEGKGVIEEASPWRPWFAANKAAPAGYATEYAVPGTNNSFTFKTVRMAGHMVAQYTPEPALVLLSDFITASSSSRPTFIL